MPRNGSTWKVLSVGLIAGIGAGYVFAFHPDKVPDWQMIRSGLAAWGAMPGCKIKGNVSFHSRERIYHVPGQKDYAATVINRKYGERWFCTEAEARAAGWRKARR